MTKKTGRCQCGAIRFTASLKNHDIGACHCETCRRNTAGPYFSIECDRPVEIEDDSAVAVYDSSEWGERRFCARCGTPLFWRMKDGSMEMVSVFALDDLSGLTFDHQVYIDEKPDFYSFSEPTQAFTGAQVMEMVAAAQQSGQGLDQKSGQNQGQDPAQN